MPLIEKREQIIKDLTDFFAQKASRYGIEMVFLYGSWARGVPKRSSDIDIAVVFSEEPPLEDVAFGYITEISVSLWAELNREVNIIQIHQDFRKPMLYYNAIVLGLPIFIKAYDRFIGLKNEAIYQMEDYSIFGPRWQYEVTEKNLETLNRA